MNHAWRHARFKLVALLTMGMVSGSALQASAASATTPATSSTESGAADPAAAAQQVFEDARRSAQPGPVKLPLAKQGVLDLPAGDAFISQPHAGLLLTAMGNPGKDPRLLGLIFPQGRVRWRCGEAVHVAQREGSARTGLAAASLMPPAR